MPKYDDLTPIDQRFHAALADINRACCSRVLPNLTAIVVRRDVMTPGDSYLAVRSPAIGDDSVVRLEAWRARLRAATETDYTATLKGIPRLRVRPMEARAWKNGDSGYGIRVGLENARRHFDPAWEKVIVEIGGRPPLFYLGETFFTTCPEIRGVAFREWFQENGLIPWEKGKPPTAS